MGGITEPLSAVSNQHCSTHQLAYPAILLICFNAYLIAFLITWLAHSAHTWNTLECPMDNNNL